MEAAGSPRRLRFKGHYKAEPESTGQGCSEYGAPDGGKVRWPYWDADAAARSDGKKQESLIGGSVDASSSR
jgi:hypothetical protein